MTEVLPNPGYPLDFLALTTRHALAIDTVQGVRITREHRVPWRTV